jgi:hypothetical protein
LSARFLITPNYADVAAEHNAENRENRRLRRLSLASATRAQGAP